MPIRIKHRDKPRDRVQPANDKGLSALLATGSMACYAGRNPKRGYALDSTKPVFPGVLACHRRRQARTPELTRGYGLVLVI